MKTKLKTPTIFIAAAILVTAWSCVAGDAKPASTTAPPVLSAMQQELDRLMAGISKSEPPDYFISYTVADRQYSEVSGSNGALLSSGDSRARWLEVQTRVGTYQLDDTHKLGDRQPSWTSPGPTMALDSDIPVLRRKFGGGPARQYRA